jgi:hypothetical protein
VVELIGIVVLAVVVVGVVVYHRFFGSDARSIAGHRTRMERLGRMDRTVGSSQGRDGDPAAGVRVLEGVAPRPVPFPGSGLEQAAGRGSPSAVALQEMSSRRPVVHGEDRRAVSTDELLLDPYDFSTGDQSQRTSPITTAPDPRPGAYGDPAAADFGGWGPPAPSAGRPAPVQATATGRSPSQTADAGGAGGEASVAVNAAAPFFDDYQLVNQSDETARSTVIDAADAGSLDQPRLSPRRFGWWARPLRRAMALGAIAIVGVVVGVMVFATGDSRPQPVTNAQPRPGEHSISSSASATHPSVTAHPAPTTPLAARPVSVTPRRAATAPSASPRRAAPPAAVGDGPAITDFSPTSGAAGQKVTLTGRNLYSANGQIILRFGSVQAAVACPDRTTCHATVPRQSFNGPAKPTRVPVTLTTDTGTSKPAVFTYR